MQDECYVVYIVIKLEKIFFYHVEVCIQMYSISMCSGEDVVMENPLTWKERCVQSVLIENAPHLASRSSKGNAKAKVFYSIWKEGERIQKDLKKKSKNNLKD